MPGQYNIYRGEGAAGNIDWDAPVGSVQAGAASAELTALGHTPGVEYWYGITAESDSGLEEQGRGVLACVELDAQGRLLPPPLAGPTELTARVDRGGVVLLGFSHPVPGGFAAAEVFEVFRDGPDGNIDLNTPLATVPNRAGAAAELEVTLALAELPARLAVRARAGARIGPLSETVTIAAAPPPQAVVLPI
jgi:hypothetical protein